MKFRKKIVPKEDFDFRRYGTTIGIFEANQNISVFYYTYKGMLPILCRVIISPEDGSVISDETIGQLQQFTMKDGYAMAYGNVPMPSFYLRKDEFSENYAIVLYNTLVSDKNKRIEVVHYNNQHKAISRAFSSSTGGEYKFIEFMDMVVHGDKEVILATLGYNTKASGSNQNGALLVGRLRAGAKNVELKKINYANAKKIEDGALKYHRYTKDLYLLTMENMGKKGNEITYSLQANIMDSSLASVNKTVQLDASKIQKIAQREYKKYGGHHAIPVDLYANSNGGFAILFEEKEVYQQAHAGSFEQNKGYQPGYRYNPGSVIQNSIAGDIGIIRYDKDMNAVGAAYVPKSYYAASPGFFNKHQFAAGGMGVSPKSSFYVNTANGGYLFFNDIAENQQLIEQKKTVKMIQDHGACEAFFFNFKNSETIPERQPIFESKGKIKTIAAFAAAAYDEKTKTLAVLTTTHHKKSPNANVVWIKLQ